MMKNACINILILTITFAYAANASENASSRVMAWGMNVNGQATGVPTPQPVTNEVILDGRPLTNCIAISAGHLQSLALLSDGTVVGWGAGHKPAIIRNISVNGISGVSIKGGGIATNVISVSAGTGQSLALLKNGSVALLEGDASQTVPVDLTNVIAISAGWQHGLALRNDGSVYFWPGTVPSDVSNIVAISATHVNYGDDLVITEAGTVLAWSRARGPARSPVGLSNIVAVAAGGIGGHGLALDKKGDVADLRNTSTDWSVHSGLSNVVAIAVGGSQYLALLRDGTIATWGGRGRFHPTVPEGLTNVVAIAAGEDFCLAIQTNSPGPITNDFPTLPKLALPTP